METAELIEWAKTTEFESPQKTAIGTIDDVDYFVNIQLLRINYGSPKEQTASIGRLLELKKAIDGN